MLLIAWLVFLSFYVYWLIRKKPYRRRPKHDPNLLDEDFKKKR